MRITLIASISAAVLALGGCANQIQAPSLGPRAVEKQPIDMPLTNGTEVGSAADPTLKNQISSLVAAAEAGDKDFAGQRARTEAAVARAAGAETGAEAWINAQQALTSLDAARGPVRDAAAAIDALRQNPANAVPGNRAAIDAAAARLREIDDAQSAAFAALGERLR